MPYRDIDWDVEGWPEEQIILVTMAGASDRAFYVAVVYVPALQTALAIVRNPEPDESHPIRTRSVPAMNVIQAAIRGALEAENCIRDAWGVENIFGATAPIGA